MKNKEELTMQEFIDEASELMQQNKKIKKIVIESEITTIKIERKDIATITTNTTD